MNQPEHQTRKNRIYIVIHQGDDKAKEFLTRLYGSHEITWVYYKEVAVTTNNITNASCSFFSFEELADEETDDEKYNELCSRTKAMINHCINDVENEFIVWDFLPKAEHYGAYIHMLHKLEEKGKKLIFNVSLSEFEQGMTNGSPFCSFTKPHIEKGVVSLIEQEEVMLN